MLEILAPAKLNWTLDVIGKRPDGFHELLSWFVPIALCDVLSLTTAEGLDSSLQVSGPESAGVPQDASNLICRAEALWRKCGGVAPHVHWQLEKFIPHGAGLGGGSSDAAAALRLLQKTATHALPLAELVEIADRLGSDVPFFLDPTQAELRAGRGEVVLARQSLSHTQEHFVLALPSFGCSTPAVYRATNAPILEATVQPKRHPLPALPTQNQLEEAAHRAYPELAAFAQSLQSFADFHLSGSGSCYFAVCPDHAAAELLASRLENVAHYIQVVPFQ